MKLKIFCRCSLFFVSGRAKDLSAQPVLLSAAVIAMSRNRGRSTRAGVAVRPTVKYISLDRSIAWLILGNNQLDALFSCIYLFQVSSCFERHSAHHQEIE